MIADSGRLKICGVYSPSHEEMYREWFLLTMQDDFEVEFRKTDQLCSLARFMSVGWVRAVSTKIEFLLEVLHSTTEDEWIIFSDVDIQWFGKAGDQLKDLTRANGSSRDMLFQEDAFGEFCTGFFVCRANERTRRFWESSLRLMRDKISGDQRVANHLLRSGSCEVTAGYLPRTFWGPGQGRGERRFWTPESSLEVPDGIILHHANWAAGVENKVRQLQYIRSLVERKTN